MGSIRDKTHEARDNDAYMTIDPRSIPALLKIIKLRGKIWEPAAGECHMVRSLEAAGESVYATDIKAYTPQLTHIQDFLTFKKIPHPHIRTIVTNPPNGLNIQFALHALKLMEPVGGMVALYQRHEWDTTKRAAPIFDHPAFAMKIIPRFRPYWIAPKPGEKSASPFHKWSWYVWDWKHRGPPIIRFSP